MVGLLADLIQTRVVIVLDLVKPNRHLRERRAEVAHRGAVLLASILARHGPKARLDDINSGGKTLYRLAFRRDKCPVGSRGLDRGGAEGRSQQHDG